MVCSAVCSLYYLLLSLKMVICIVPGCSKRSDRYNDVSFFRLPAIRTEKGKKELLLSRKRRAGYLAAISKDLSKYGDLSHVRICSRHFISGKPAYFFDHLNPDWLPTLNINSKLNEKVLIIAATGQISEGKVKE